MWPGRFLNEVLAHARLRDLLSDDHFSVDGTLFEAWASMKRFRPKDANADSTPPPAGRNAERDFQGDAVERDPRLDHRPGRPADAQGSGEGSQALLRRPRRDEKRNGLVVAAQVTPATGNAERDAAKDMVAAMPGRHAITLSADKAYDTQDFVASMRAMRVTPHVAQNTAGRRSRIDRRTTRHPGYAISQRVRKQIRGDLRLGQDDRRPAQDPPPWHRPGRLDVHPRRRRLQPRPHPQTCRRDGMSASDDPKSAKPAEPSPRRSQRASPPRSRQSVTLTGFSAAC